MYNDILLSGGRSFATCMVNEETGQFAETAMIFYLDELKEVSQQTNDQVKYICKHQATRRVNLKKVLNPKVWKDGSTYLKVQVEDLEDVDTEETYPDDDQLLMQVCYTCASRVLPAPHNATHGTDLQGLPRGGGPAGQVEGGATLFADAFLHVQLRDQPRGRGGLVAGEPLANPGK